MNITIITEVLPWPLNSGGAQGQYNMIEQLRKEHHFTLIFMENGQNKSLYMKELQAKWPEVKIVGFPLWRQLLYLPFFKDKAERALKLKFIPENTRFKVQRILQPYGMSFSRDFTHFVNQIIRQEHTDLIEVDFFTCLHIINFLPPDIKKVFIHHELRYIRNIRMTQSMQLTKRELRKMEDLKTQEITDLKKYDAIVTVTEQDKEYLLKEGIKTPIYVSPSAVQTLPCSYKSWNGRLSYVGGYNHVPNQEGIDWYIANVLPIMGKKAPILDIVGKKWPEKYSSQYINLTGFVEHLPDVIHGSIMIVPLRTGSGMRMKIIEAMAMSMPIITTSIGVEGIELIPNESCIVADTPQDFAQAIQFLADNPNKCQQLGINAHQVFLKNYSVERLSAIRNGIYKKV